MSRAMRLLVSVGLVAVLAVPASAQGPTPISNKEAENAKINKRIEENFADVQKLRGQIEDAAALAAAKQGATEMRAPLGGLRKAIDDKYDIVKGLFADLKRLTAENEELKRQLAAKEHPAPSPCECQPECCLPYYECSPRWGWFGRHK